MHSSISLGQNEAFSCMSSFGSNIRCYEALYLLYIVINRRCITNEIKLSKGDINYETACEPDQIWITYKLFTKYLIIVWQS